MSSYNLHSKEFNPVSEPIQAPDTRLLPGVMVTTTPFLNLCFYSPVTAITWPLQINGEKRSSPYLLTFPLHFCFYLILLSVSKHILTELSTIYLPRSHSEAFFLALYLSYISILLSFITLPNSVHCLYNPFILCTAKNTTHKR